MGVTSNDVVYQYNKTGDYVENQKITFQEVYTEFIEKEAPATRAYATIVRYKSLYRNHFADRFDSFYMYQISANSIQQHGVLSPIIARPHKDGGYEILSGHRRAKACELAGIKEVPVIIKNIPVIATFLLLEWKCLQWQENCLILQK